MKCAVIIASDLRQVMLTPETEEEKYALSIITTNDDITVDIKSGTFYSYESPPSAHGYTVQECKGDYLRAYSDTNSIMLVLRPKKGKKK